jgi:hypothetical protein
LKQIKDLALLVARFFYNFVTDITERAKLLDQLQYYVGRINYKWGITNNEEFNHKNAKKVQRITPLAIFKLTAN